MYCNRTPSSRVKDEECILTTLKKIDQLQKEALIQEQCDNCVGGLMYQLFNTKPVRLYLCNGETFEAVVPLVDSITTDIFRVESIKGECVVLRLIVPEGEELECTNFTITLKVDCICAVQCLQPICCEPCQGTACPTV